MERDRIDDCCAHGLLALYQTVGWRPSLGSSVTGRQLCMRLPALVFAKCSALLFCLRRPNGLPFRSAAFRAAFSLLQRTSRSPVVRSYDTSLEDSLIGPQRASLHAPVTFGFGSSWIYAPPLASLPLDCNRSFIDLHRVTIDSQRSLIESHRLLSSSHRFASIRIDSPQLASTRGYGANRSTSK